MKRCRFNILISFLLSVCILISCSANENPDNSGRPTRDAGTDNSSEITIALAGVDGGGFTVISGDEATLKKQLIYRYALKYMEENPGRIIKFEYTECKTFEEIDNYILTIPALLQREDPPDIVLPISYSMLQSDGDMNLLADIGKLAERDESFNRSDYFENILDIYTFGDELKGIPLGFSFHTMAINKKYLPLLTGGRNVPEYIRLSDMADVYNQALNMYPEETLYITDIVNQSASLTLFIDTQTLNDDGTIDINSNENLSLFETWTSSPECTDTELMTRLRYSDSESASLVFGSVYGPDMSKNVYFGDNWFDNPASAFTVPVALVNKDMTLRGGSTHILTINERSKNKEAAWDFIKFCIDEIEYAPNNISPGRCIPINRENFRHTYRDILTDAYEKLPIENKSAMSDRDSVITSAINRMESMAERYYIGRNYLYIDTAADEKIMDELNLYLQGIQSSMNTLEKINLSINEAIMRRINAEKTDTEETTKEDREEIK